MRAPQESDAAPREGGAGVSQTDTTHEFIQLPLFPPSRRNAPRGTSHVAARRIAGHAATLRERIFAFIAERGVAGATDDEGEAALSIKCQTYTPRRGELVALGLLVDSGKRRNTTSGRPAAVWTLPEFAPTLEGGGA